MKDDFMKNDMKKHVSHTERSIDDMPILKDVYLKQQMSDEQLTALKARMEQAKKENRMMKNKKTIRNIAATAAVAATVFVALPNASPNIAYAMEQVPVLGQLVELVTIRDYQYESDRNNAQIETPNIAVGKDADEQLTKTTDEINQEIARITDELTKEFEANLYDEGYQDVIVKGEVLTTEANYFTLKLICYQGAGSGYEWNYYYTIDLTTGERLRLSDLFKEGSDYITPISENIKEQMQAQMDADEMITYWLDGDVEEWNFKTITDDTSFYLNESGNVVIGFDEGEVAPMYMGTVEFEIPAEALTDIRK